MVEIDMEDISSFSAMAEILQVHKLHWAACKIVQPHSAASNERRFRPVVTVWINPKTQSNNVHMLLTPGKLPHFVGLTKNPEVKNIQYLTEE